MAGSPDKVQQTVKRKPPARSERQPANFDEAVIDAQLARRKPRLYGCLAPQYGHGPVPKFDEPQTMPERAP